MQDLESISTLPPFVLLPPEPAPEDGSRPETSPTVEFVWTKARHKIRQAAQQFSEETHADY